MPGPAITAPRPAGPTQAQVAQVRAFNRFYTNVIGVLHDMYLDTPYTLTESRLLFEIARLGTAEVPWLRQALDIDAGYLSRVLGRFESDGLVTRHRSAADARRQEIRATEAGRAAVAELDERAVGQIGALLGGVDCGPVLDAMRVITQALGRRSAAGDAAPGRVTLRPLADRRPGLDTAAARHAVRRRVRLGRQLRGVLRADRRRVRGAARPPPGARRGLDRGGGRRAGRLGLLRARRRQPGSTPGGGTTARLRLLLVEPWARGTRLGARLVDRCLDFARAAGYTDIVLLTYDQLAAARRVYQAAGFTLDSEHPEDAFGQHMMSQTWSRPL